MGYCLGPEAFAVHFVWPVLGVEPRVFTQSYGSSLFKNNLFWRQGLAKWVSCSPSPSGHPGPHLCNSVLPGKPREDLSPAGG